MSGWHPGRRVNLPPSQFSDWPLFPAAREVLAEFGGLRVGTTGRGLECARSDVHFDVGGFDPSDPALHDWRARVGCSLFPIGTAHLEYLDLFVAEDGRIFEMDIVAGDFGFVGSSFIEAMETLLRGKRIRPILRHDADDILAYGETYRRGDPRIYDLGPGTHRTPRGEMPDRPGGAGPAHDLQ